jgi:hypothetical protein
MRGHRELSVEQLLKSVQAASGVAWSFPEDDLRLDGLRRLVAELAVNARRDAAKMQALRLDLSRLIAASLAVEADGEGPAPTTDQPQSGPLFVIGFGRTGSTFIHNLLALDPKARAPRLWELWYPTPARKPESYADDRRIVLARSMLDYFEKASPLISQIHPMDAEGPDECNHLMLHNTHLAMMYGAPGYWEWLKQLDNPQLRRLFSHYRTQVHYLQRFFAGRRWLSKSLAHLHFLPVLFDVFPNAKVIRLHRDPCELVPSLCNLYANLRKLFQESVDPVGVGRMVSDVFLDGMDRMMRSASDRTSRDHVDVMFREMIANPIGTVANIYARFGYDYTPEFDRAMRHYLADAPKAMRSNHSYGLEEFGLTRKSLTERSESYLSWLHGRTGMSLVG